MRLLLFLTAVVLFGVSLWYLTAPRIRFDLTGRRRRSDSLLAILGSLLVERFGGAEMLRQSDAMGWPRERPMLLAATVTFALVVFVALAVSVTAALVSAPLAAVIAWTLTRWAASRSYRSWQEEMVRGLPAMLATLRVHLDLGRTVPEALSASLQGAPPTLRREMTRVLADMRTAPAAKSALVRLAERVGRLEFKTVADTITQAWEADLSGEALEPLMDLLRITRDRETKEATERLDLVLTVAPGLAIFAVTVWGVGGFLLHSFVGALFSP